MRSILKTGLRIIVLVSSVALVLFALGSLQAFAQNEPDSFTNAQLWIYPEYDDPRLLVMLEGKIEGTEPPAEVKFLVPSTAEMYSAGSMDAQGRYSGGPPDRQPSSIPGWDEISYQVTTDTFRMEYYDPIIFGNPEKTITYVFQTIFPVADLEIIIQEPISATDFTISPEGDRFVDSAGFNSSLYQYTDLSPDSAIQFEINYTRTTTTPSLSLSGDTLTPSSGEKETTNYTWIVVILSVIVVIIIVVFLWQRKATPATRAERRRVTRKSIKQVPQDSSLTPKFCSQCGNSIDKQDKFCPNCGTKIQ